MRGLGASARLAPMWLSSSGSYKEQVGYIMEQHPWIAALHNTKCMTLCLWFYDTRAHENIHHHSLKFPR